MVRGCPSAGSPYVRVTWAAPLRSGEGLGILHDGFPFGEDDETVGFLIEEGQDRWTVLRDDLVLIRYSGKTIQLGKPERLDLAAVARKPSKRSTIRRRGPPCSRALAGPVR